MIKKINYHWDVEFGALCFGGPEAVAHLAYGYQWPYTKARHKKLVVN